MCISARQARVCLALILGLGFSRVAAGQTPVTLANTSETTVVTAAVVEQARITVPAGLAFDVTNVTAATSTTAAVSIENIVLATATKQLRISLTANASSFAPPSAGSTTWSASDVSWSRGTGANGWVNATGTHSVLSSSSYNTVATCAAGATSCSISKLSFDLAAKSTVQRSGNHTLTVTWKFESIGS